MTSVDGQRWAVHPGDRHEDAHHLGDRRVDRHGYRTGGHLCRYRPDPTTTTSSACRSTSPCVGDHPEILRTIRRGGHDRSPGPCGAARSQTDRRDFGPARDDHRAWHRLSARRSSPCPRRGRSQAGLASNPCVAGPHGDGHRGDDHHEDDHHEDDHHADDHHEDDLRRIGPATDGRRARRRSDVHRSSACHCLAPCAAAPETSSCRGRATVRPIGVDRCRPHRDQVRYPNQTACAGDPIQRLAGWACSPHHPALLRPSGAKSKYP